MTTVCNSYANTNDSVANNGYSLVMCSIISVHSDVLFCHMYVIAGGTGYIGFRGRTGVVGATGAVAYGSFLCFLIWRFASLYFVLSKQYY